MGRNGQVREDVQKETAWRSEIRADSQLDPPEKCSQVTLSFGLADTFSELLIARNSMYISHSAWDNL